jgi:dolichol-phosphate mannosyltransferase
MVTPAAVASAVPDLSIVVPMYDEEAVVPLFTERMRPVLDGLALLYEVVVVDDGSRDTTPALLEKARRDWPQLRVIRLRANAGHQAALSAGLQRARGEWVATIDADLQDPPETLAAMLTQAQACGADVVYGVRSDRTTDSLFKRVTASAYYRMIRRLVGQHVPSDAGDFRLMSRATVDAGSSSRRLASRAPRCHIGAKSARPAPPSTRSPGCSGSPSTASPGSRSRHCGWPPGSGWAARP